jgi:predicted heme/steroid binding protein
MPAKLSNYLVLTSLLVVIIALISSRIYQPSYPTGYKLPNDLQVFTKDQLSAFKGNESKTSLIYISIIGHVYDVTNGRQFYGPDGGYAGFAGRDGTRAFVSGNFTEDGLIENIDDMKDQELFDIWEWKSFYDKEEKYIFKGYVDGMYINKHGVKLPYYFQCEKRVEELKLKKMHEKDLKSGHPTCNSRWESGKGSKVWCEEGRVPRKWFLDPTKDAYACYCFASPNVLPKEGRLEEYKNCVSTESVCEFPPE